MSELDEVYGNVGEYMYVPIKDISVKQGHNKRKSTKPRYELSVSVQRKGVMTPIAVRSADKEDKYWIVDGECRYKAAMAAGLQYVPCEFLGKMTDEEAFWHHIDKNKHKKFNKEEELECAKYCLERDLPSAEASQKLGWKLRKVQRYYQVLKKGTSLVHKVLEKGRVSLKTAAALTSLPKEEQAETVKEVADLPEPEAEEKILTKKELKGLIKKKKVVPAKEKMRPFSPELKERADRRSRRRGIMQKHAYLFEGEEYRVMDPYEPFNPTGTYPVCADIHLQAERIYYEVLRKKEAGKGDNDTCKAYLRILDVIAGKRTAKDVFGVP